MTHQASPPASASSGPERPFPTGAPSMFPAFKWLCTRGFHLGVEQQDQPVAKTARSPRTSKGLSAFVGLERSSSCWPLCTNAYTNYRKKVRIGVNSGQSDRRSQQNQDCRSIAVTACPFKRNNPLTRVVNGLRRCGADRDRTGNLLVANQALSQLSYGPQKLGFTVKIRQTFDVNRERNWDCQDRRGSDHR